MKNNSLTFNLLIWLIGGENDYVYDIGVLLRHQKSEVGYLLGGYHIRDERHKKNPVSPL